MSWSHGERLYQSLPAVYRIRDAAQGEPLRALMSAIESELEIVEADIEGLHENWFIETCDEWVVPYIADLLGVRHLHTLDSAGLYSLRAYIANTLRYRRRKGTAAVLEQLARDVSGWPARVAEFFQHLATTQHTNHVRLHSLANAGLRDSNTLEWVDGPFETVTHNAEVRRIDSHRGRYNIPNVGLFVWRLQSYSVDGADARPVQDPTDGRYTFHPLGIDAALFNRPQTETEITHLAEEINVPGALRRRALYDDLETYRERLAGSEKPGAADYFGDNPVLAVAGLTPEELRICDLSDWDDSGWTPPVSENLQRADGSHYDTRVAVDPALGRLVYLQGITPPADVVVDYAYGFSADVGGGPYDRRQSVNEALALEVSWQVGVARDATAVPDQIFNNLKDAVQAWNAQPPGTVGVIAIMDSRSYAEDLTGADAVTLAAGSLLMIVAAGWPEQQTDTGPVRHIGRLAPDELRPHLRGNVSVRGTAADEAPNPGTLVLNGLLVEGDVRVLAGNLGRLMLSHTTVVPGGGQVTVNASATPGDQNDHLQLQLVRSITGRVELPEKVPELIIRDSIIDAGEGDALIAPGSAVTIETSTLLGTVTLRSLQASESIFTAPVNVERRQTGCVRFSVLPVESRTPRRYRCQPDLALKGVEDTALQASIAVRLTPLFESTDYGNPAYLQLSTRCAVEIRSGAGDGSEMGVFQHLKQPQREANLMAAVGDYLPFGLAAGTIFVN